MKKLILFFLLVLPLSVITDQTTAAQKEKTVYICTGPKATTYHKTKDCRGLKKCSGEVKAVTESKAKTDKRSACKICHK